MNHFCWTFNHWNFISFIWTFDNLIRSTNRDRTLYVYWMNECPLLIIEYTNLLFIVSKMEDTINAIRANSVVGCSGCPGCAEVCRKIGDRMEHMFRYRQWFQFKFKRGTPKSWQYVGIIDVFSLTKTLTILLKFMWNWGVQLFIPFNSVNNLSSLPCPFRWIVTFFDILTSLVRWIGNCTWGSTLPQIHPLQISTITNIKQTTVLINMLCWTNDNWF